MSISIVGGSVGTGTTTINKPAGVASGDLLLMLIHSDSASTAPTAPAGWTAITSVQDAKYYSAAAYLVAGASEPGSYTWTAGTGSSFNAGAIVALSGQDATTPIDAHGTGTGTSGSVTVSALTASVAGDMLVEFSSDFNDLGVSSWPESGSTLSSASGLTTGDFQVGTASGLASGSTGTLTTTYNSGASFLGNIVILVKASGGGGIVNGSPTMVASSLLLDAMTPVQANGVLSVTGGIAGSGGTPSTIGTTTEVLGLTVPNSHLSAYSGVSGSNLWYVVYNDGTNWVWRSSSDGVTWSSAATVTGFTGDPASNMGPAGLVVDSAGVLHWMSQVSGGNQQYSQYGASGWFATPVTVDTSSFAGLVPGMYESGGHKYIWLWGFGAPANNLGGDVAQDPTSSANLAQFGFALYVSAGSGGPSWHDRASMGLEFYGTNGITLGTDAGSPSNLNYHTFNPTLLSNAGQFTSASVLSNASLDTAFASGVDGSGNVHVLYRIIGTGWLEAVWNGTSWTTGGSLPQITDNDRSPALALDSNGLLHCFYARQNAANDYGVGHLTFASGSWTAKGDTVAHNSTNRQTVTVSRKDGGGNLLVVWLEGTASPYTVEGILVSTSSGSTVSGSATLAGNSLLLDAMTPVPAQSAVAQSATILAPATVQANAAMSVTAQVIAPANVASASALAETAQIVAPATAQASSLIAESAQLLSTHATAQGNATSTETAQIVAPAVVQSNSVLAATGSIGGLISGGGTVQANSAMTVRAIILTPALIQSSAAVSETAILLTTAAALVAQAAASVSVAQVTTPTAAAAASTALNLSAALVLAASSLAASSVLAEASALLLAPATVQGNSVLSATGHIPLAANYRSPVGTTASTSTRLTGATVLLSTEPAGSTALSSTELVGMTVEE